MALAGLGEGARAGRWDGEGDKTGVEFLVDLPVVVAVVIAAATACFVVDFGVLAGDFLDDEEAGGGNTEAAHSAAFALCAATSAGVSGAGTAGAGEGGAAGLAGVCFAAFFVDAALPFFVVDGGGGGGGDGSLSSSTGVDVLLLFAAGVAPVSFAGVEALLGGIFVRDRLDLTVNFCKRRENE